MNIDILEKHFISAFGDKVVSTDATKIVQGSTYIDGTVQIEPFVIHQQNVAFSESE
jgi:hypothetical protein